MPNATAPSELKVAPRRPRILTLICTQVPTVLTLFDVDMSVREARGKVKDMFRQNAHIEDPRTAAILVHKGKAERAAAFESYSFRTWGPATARLSQSALIGSLRVPAGSRRPCSSTRQRRRSCTSSNLETLPNSKTAA